MLGIKGVYQSNLLSYFISVSDPAPHFLELPLHLYTCIYTEATK